MENNKLLIGVQFISQGSINMELFVPQDISLKQLLGNIGTMLNQLDAKPSKNKEIYASCLKTYNECISILSDKNERKYYNNIKLLNFDGGIINNQQLGIWDKAGHFYKDELNAPIYKLGFITSSCLIFDSTGSYAPDELLDTSKLIAAFQSTTSQDIFYPEYNISTRQMYQFDITSVDIIPPTAPPQQNNTSLFSLILPSFLSVLFMVVIRMFMTYGNVASGLRLSILSAGMGFAALITTTLNWKRQKKAYNNKLTEWRVRYQDYIKSLIETIQTRQNNNVKKLNELYPDVESLMEISKNGIYSLNDNIYSRSSNDSDFLMFRIGTSNAVPSIFDIHGEEKDAVFSESDFIFVKDDGKDSIRISLLGEQENENSGKLPLYQLPVILSKRYTYLPNAPFLYSLKNKVSLGIVDKQLDSDNAYPAAQYFITRMIFELCYYHSPNDLQFIMFFKDEGTWENMQNAISSYRFMPHFRGLLSDRSQFVFDKESAGQVMSSLLSIMNDRKSNPAESSGTAMPHIVIVIFSEHGLKEHAFAEYLPKAPPEDSASSNNLGLSFVFIKKYKEHLPPYCDDIVYLGSEDPVVVNHSDETKRQVFRFGSDAFTHDQLTLNSYQSYSEKSKNAFRFFSSIYHAKVAQNGKVPSNVGLFELTDCNVATISNNWGVNGIRTLPGVTESLRVPIGKTETGNTYLDLHEKADGPHMLVAGTTGSGKTEAIITYLLGLCMRYRPDELNLLLVDMKGGGFTKRLGHLPHVVGSVTDVEGDENGTGAEYMLNRFLNAMKAEIKRRKILFNKLMVDSIDAYINACKHINDYLSQKELDEDQKKEMKETAQNNPLTHLILVVDEFTELKRFTNKNSETDFIGEITTIARVGRSLGFHIILISQNIEGAITDDIRVNSRAKLCLKVATKQASKEMIGTELAASPQMPGNGRAYLLVGSGSRFEYFQSGYSGAKITQENPVEITLANMTGTYRTFYQTNQNGMDDKTQLESVCEAIISVYKNRLNSFEKKHVIFRPPLPSFIALDKNGKRVDLSRKRGDRDDNADGNL